MPIYQTAKITPWSMESVDYELDSEYIKLIPYFGQNWFEFSDGSKSYFTGLGGGWQLPNQTMGGEEILPPRVCICTILIINRNARICWM